MDEIDELVDASLAQRFQKKSTRSDRCPHCGLPWHGLPFLGCPGSHVPADQARRARSTVLHWSTGDSDD